MKSIKSTFILFLICLLADVNLCLAAGALKKAKRVADSMAGQQSVLDQEDDNFRRAEEFISGEDISQGLTFDYIIANCGEPVARVRDDTEWVYKPTSSSFFKGEKIYFIFNEGKNLIRWERVEQ